MNLTFPRDIQSYHPYRKLIALVGGERAFTLLFKLWIELGYQIEIHGGSGTFATAEAETFLLSIAPTREAAAADFKALTSSGVLVPSGQDWVCPIFALNNRHLDASFVPHTTKGRMVQVFNGRRRQAEKATPSIISELVEECWTTPAGRVGLDDMKRAIVLIKTIDGILRLPDRPHDKFTPCLIHGALKIVKEFTEAKLHVILRTLHVRKQSCNLTRETSYYIENFETVILKVMPAEGFIEWNKKLSD